jgi:TRAP transporter TAXI family solute receptor
VVEDRFFWHQTIREGGVEMRKIKVAKVLSVLSVILFYASFTWAVEWPEDIKVISPAPGATIHMIHVGMGKVVPKYTPAKNWIVQPLGGPQVWAKAMREERCDFANYNNAEAINIFFGRQKFKKMGPQAIRTIATGHVYAFMFWTIPDTKIKNIADLKGKSAYIAFRGNPSFINLAKVQLASAGLTFADLKSNTAFSHIKDGTMDLIEGRVDTILYPLVPSAIMQINEAKKECVFVGLTDEQAKNCMKELKGYFLENIPAQDPRFRNKSAIPNATCYQNGMFTRADMHPEIVYGVVKAILEHTDEYADTHPSAKFWSYKYKPVGLSVPYHEGAIRYFKEKGLWTKEAQSYQEEMLAKQKVLLKEFKEKE